MPCRQLSKTFPEMEILDAYRVQDLWAKARIAAGAGLAGHKLGLPSPAMQMASKMTELDWGRILDDALYYDGAEIKAKPSSSRVSKWSSPSSWARTFPARPAASMT